MIMKIKYFAVFLILLSASAWSKCQERQILFETKDPIDASNWSIETKAYLPKGKSGKKFPVIFVLPTIVGETLLERKLAKRLCKNGMGAYVVNVVKILPFEQQITNLNIHNDLYVRALSGIKHLISKLENDQNLTQEYGIIGASQGGMIATYVAGSEPRIKSTVIIVAGGDIPGILSESDQKGVTQQREARIAHFNLSNNYEYRDLLLNKVPNNPLSVAHFILPNSLYFFLATQDTTVPTHFQKELRERIQQPLSFEMKASHVEGVIKATTLHFSKISTFFLNRFN